MTMTSCLSSFLCAALAALALPSTAVAFPQTLYVDPANGDDTSPGSADRPLATLMRAAEMANAGESGATTIRLHPGLHVLAESPLFHREAPYDFAERLVIEAVHLPDDPDWTPSLMPVVLSTEEPQVEDVLVARGLRIEVSHATVRGVKFLGNPWPGTHYYAIWREGLELEDLVVTQCLFLGDRGTLPIHLPIIANGNGLVVDHCIFSGCKNSVVFWNGPGGESFGNAMTYCIVEGAYASAVWTCSTEDDFEFHHNILTRSRYAWIREYDSQRTFEIDDCLISANEQRAGYGGGASGDLETTEAGFLRAGPGVVDEGEVVLSRDASSRDYLHLVPDTPGSDLGAGLFVVDLD
jgi:hypothetical protein